MIAFNIQPITIYFYKANEWMHLKSDTHIAHKLLLIRKHILTIFAYLNLKPKYSFGK